MKKSYNMEECGARIRWIRKQHGYTQEKLAEELNVDRSVLSRIEAGKYACSIDFLVLVAAYFDVSLDVLVFGKVPARVSTQVKTSIDDIIRRLEQLKECL